MPGRLGNCFLENLAPVPAPVDTVSATSRPDQRAIWTRLGDFWVLFRPGPGSAAARFPMARGLFKSGCFVWEGWSRFAKVIVSRRRNERWRCKASAQIRRPKKKRCFVPTRRNIFSTRRFDPDSRGLLEEPSTSSGGDFPWVFEGFMS